MNMTKIPVTYNGSLTASVQNRHGTWEESETNTLPADAAIELILTENFDIDPEALLRQYIRENDETPGKEEFNAILTKLGINPVDGRWIYNKGRSMTKKESNTGD